MCSVLDYPELEKREHYIDFCGVFFGLADFAAQVSTSG